MNDQSISQVIEQMVRWCGKARGRILGCHHVFTHSTY